SDPSREESCLKWLLRFSFLTSLFFPPCYFARGLYQSLLTKSALFVLAILHVNVQFENLVVNEPISLGLFAAMCLASRTAPPGERLRAIVIAIPQLAVLTVLLLAA